MRQSESENWSKVFFRVVIDRRAAKEREKFVCNFGFLGPFSVLVLVFFSLAKWCNELTTDESNAVMKSKVSNSGARFTIFSQNSMDDPAKEYYEGESPMHLALVMNI